MSTIIAAYLACLVLAASPLFAEDFVVRVPMDSLRFQSGTIDVAGYHLEDNQVDIIISENQVAMLENAAVPHTVIARHTEGMADPQYTDYQEAIAKMKTLEQRYPGLAQLINLNQRYGLQQTHQKRDIWALKISDDVTADQDEAAVNFNGAHHARELMTIETVLDIADYLLGNYAKDPRVKRWVDSYEIWLVPVVNPDGVNTVFAADNWWRKNMRKNDEKTFGVDLNRNYLFKWGACGGSSTLPGSETYRGPAAGSEPEAQVMMRLAQDRHIAASVSYHSYGNVVLFPPYGCTTAKLPDGEAPLMEQLAKEYAALMTKDDGKLGYGYRNRLYGVDGLDRDWLFHQFGSISFVTEIGAGDFQPDYKLYRDKIVLGLRAGWQYLLDRVSGPSIQGHIVDKATGLPIRASYTVKGFAYYEGEQRANGGKHGRYFIPLNSGTYDVTFAAAGYTPHTLSVKVDKAPTILDIALQKAPPSPTIARKLQ